MKPHLGSGCSALFKWFPFPGLLCNLSTLLWLSSHPALHGFFFKDKVHQNQPSHSCHHCLVFTVFSVNHHWLLKLLYFLLMCLDQVIIFTSLLLPDGHLQFKPLPPESLPNGFCVSLLYVAGIKTSYLSGKYSSKQKKKKSPFPHTGPVFFVQFSCCYCVILFCCGLSKAGISMH